MRYPLIGVTGQMGSGKDTVGNLLRPYGYERVGFADPLKSMALTLNPIITASITSGSEREPWRLADEVAFGGWDESKRRFAEIRRILQVLGTECVRAHLGEDAWIKAMERRLWPPIMVGPKAINEYPPAERRYVICDLRFLNEAAAIRRWSGRVWKVVRPGHDGDLHASEIEVPKIEADIVIENDGTITDLQRKIEALVPESAYA